MQKARFWKAWQEVWFSGCVHWDDAGAWTGEMSPVMLADCNLDLARNADIVPPLAVKP